MVMCWGKSAFQRLGERGHGRGLDWLVFPSLYLSLKGLCYREGTHGGADQREHPRGGEWANAEQKPIYHLASK